jgi:hypothetical protein
MVNDGFPRPAKGVVGAQDETVRQIAGSPGTSDPLYLTAIHPASGVSATVRVRGDVPSRELGAYIANSVGVTFVGALLRFDGAPITPDAPLRAQGVEDGSPVLVMGVGEAPPAFIPLQPSDFPLQPSKDAAGSTPSAPTSPDPLPPAVAPVESAARVGAPVMRRAVPMSPLVVPGPPPDDPVEADGAQSPMTDDQSQDGSGVSVPGGRARSSDTATLDATDETIRAAPADSMGLATRTDPPSWPIAGPMPPGGLRRASAKDLPPPMSPPPLDQTAGDNDASANPTVEPSPSVVEAGSNGAAPALAPPPRTTPIPPRHTVTPPPRRSTVRKENRRTRRRTVGIVIVATGAAVGLFALGGLVFHDSSSASSAPVSPVANAAAQAWLRAAPYHGAAIPGVPLDLARSGSINGSLDPVASWDDSASSGELFIVSVPGQQSFGLAVTLVHSKLSLPPTVTGLPFSAGSVPTAVGASAAVPALLPGALRSWSAGLFGTASGPGSLTPALALGATGTPQLTAAWSAKAGGTVYRTQLNLTSDAPGTVGAEAAADAAQVSAAQKAATAALGVLARAKSAAAAAMGKLATDQAAANSIPAANSPVPAANSPVPAANSPVPASTTSSTTISTTVASRGGAPPTTALPGSPVQQAAMAAIAPDTVALQNANTALAKAQTASTQAQNALRGAQSQEAHGPKVTPTVRVLGTYDVWVRASGQVAGWGPAGFSES